MSVHRWDTPRLRRGAQLAITAVAGVLLLVTTTAPSSLAVNLTPLVVGSIPSEDEVATSAMAHTTSRLFGLFFSLQYGNLAAEVMTPDAQNQTPLGLYTGPDEFTVFAQRLWAAFPDAVFVVDELVETTDSMAVRWSMAGTHQGRLGSIAATGERVELHGLALLHFEDGFITDSWFEFDLFSLSGLADRDSDSDPSTCPTCWVAV